MVSVPGWGPPEVTEKVAWLVQEFSMKKDMPISSKDSNTSMEKDQLMQGRTDYENMLPMTIGIKI